MILKCKEIVMVNRLGVESFLYVNYLPSSPTSINNQI